MTTPKPYPEAASISTTLPNQVSEAVAAPYLTRSELERGTYYRQPAPRYIGDLPAADDVWNFAQEHALSPHIETAVRLAREHFKKIREIKLTYSPDPEIPHWETIVIDLYLTGDADDKLQSAYTAYTRAFIEAVPKNDRRKINLLLWID
jgi:hypothetical protein